MHPKLKELILSHEEETRYSYYGKGFMTLCWGGFPLDQHDCIDIYDPNEIPVHVLKKKIEGKECGFIWYNHPLKRLEFWDGARAIVMI